MTKGRTGLCGSPSYVHKAMKTRLGLHVNRTWFKDGWARDQPVDAGVCTSSTHNGNVFVPIVLQRCTCSVAIYVKAQLNGSWIQGTRISGDVSKFPESTGQTCVNERITQWFFYAQPGFCGNTLNWVECEDGKLQATLRNRARGYQCSWEQDRWANSEIRTWQCRLHAPRAKSRCSCEYEVLTARDTSLDRLVVLTYGPVFINGFV